MQKEAQDGGLTLEDYLPLPQEQEAKKGALHEENPFGISLVADGEEQSCGTAQQAPRTPSTTGCLENVDDLAAKLKSLQS